MANELNLLSAIFSFRNEEEGMDELVARMRSTLDPLGIDYELIFVNDDSTDGSLEILKKYNAEDPRIKIVNMSRRFGHYPCALAGFKCARGDAMVMISTDLQDPPELIPEMIEKFKAGADVVNTVRTKRLGENPLKMWITKKAYQVINALSDIELPENMGDFKLLSRKVVNELMNMKELDPYLRGIIRWIGFHQETVYYVRAARYSGKTHFPLLGKGPIQEFIRGVTAFSSAPLYACLIYGFIISLLAFLYLIVVVTTKIIGVNLPGWSAIMAAILFLGGNTLLTNGVLGLYIARMYDQIKERPRYIISEKIGFEGDTKKKQMLVSWRKRKEKPVNPEV